MAFVGYGQVIGRRAVARPGHCTYPADFSGEAEVDGEGQDGKSGLGESNYSTGIQIPLSDALSAQQVMHERLAENGLPRKHYQLDQNPKLSNRLSALGSWNCVG